MYKYISGFIIIVIINSMIFFSLEKISDRNTKNIVLPETIQKELKNHSCSNQEEVLTTAFLLTSNYLSFKRTNNISNKQANCIGYSQLCSSIINELCKINNINGHAKPVVGYVKYGNINCCKVLQFIVPNKYKLFFSNHDFIEFNCKNTIIYYDPTLYDLIGIDCKTYIKF